MKISDAELGALDVDGEVDFAATAEVLDIAVSPVLGTSYQNVSCIMRVFLGTSDVPGIVLAPSLPTFALISSEAEPA
jgi:hypothetical protein